VEATLQAAVQEETVLLSEPHKMPEALAVLLPINSEVAAELVGQMEQV
jgi:hypothetical protein